MNLCRNLLLGGKYFMLAAMGSGWLVLLTVVLRLTPLPDSALTATTAVFTMAGLMATALSFGMALIGVAGMLAWTYWPFPRRPERELLGQSRCDQVR